MSIERSFETKINKDWVLTLSRRVINTENGFDDGDEIKIDIRIDPKGNSVWSKDTTIPDHRKIRIPKTLYLISPSKDIYVTVTKKEMEE
jgi:hypothetical protein